MTIENRKNTEKEYMFGGRMTKNDFVVLPADDPIRGLFGCLVFEKENESNSLIYEQKLYDACEVIDCEDADNFFYALQFSLDSNYPTFIYDQPQRLRIGFISLNASGNPDIFSVGEESESLKPIPSRFSFLYFLLFKNQQKRRKLINNYRNKTHTMKTYNIKLSFSCQ